MRNRFGFRNLFYTMIAENLLLVAAIWAIFAFAPLDFKNVNNHTSQLNTFSSSVADNLSNIKQVNNNIVEGYDIILN